MSCLLWQLWQDSHVERAEKRERALKGSHDWQGSCNKLTRDETGISCGYPPHSVGIDPGWISHGHVTVPTWCKACFWLLETT